MQVRTASTGVFLGCSGYALPPKERCKNTINLTPGDEAIRDKADYVLTIPRSHPLVTPILAVLPLQSLAYHLARNGEKDMELLAPITTKPWGKHIPQLRDVPAPTKEQRDSQLLYNEPKYIRFDDGDIHTLESNGLKLVAGVESY